MATREDAVIINSLVRQALTSMQEVMGDNGLNAVLKTCNLEKFVGNFPPNNLEPSIKASQYAQLNQAMRIFTVAPARACCAASARLRSSTAFVNKRQYSALQALP